MSRDGRRGELRSPGCEGFQGFPSPGALGCRGRFGAWIADRGTRTPGFLLPGRVPAWLSGLALKIDPLLLKAPLLYFLGVFCCCCWGSWRPRPSLDTFCVSSPLPERHGAGEAPAPRSCPSAAAGSIRAGSPATRSRSGTGWGHGGERRAAPSAGALSLFLLRNNGQ